MPNGARTEQHVAVGGLTWRGVDIDGWQQQQLVCCITLGLGQLLHCADPQVHCVD